MRTFLAALLVYLLPMAHAVAGEADVVDAKVVLENDGTWRIHVTVAHDDEGWDHYADRWEIRTEDGRLIGTRVLLHPHENEQPFTRSLGGLAIPEDVTTLVVKANDSVHGGGGAEFRVTLPR